MTDAIILWRGWMNLRRGFCFPLFEGSIILTRGSNIPLVKGFSFSKWRSVLVISERNVVASCLGCCPRGTAIAKRNCPRNSRKHRRKTSKSFSKVWEAAIACFKFKAILETLTFTKNIPHWSDEATNLARNLKRSSEETNRLEVDKDFVQSHWSASGGMRHEIRPIRMRYSWGDKGCFNI